MDSAVPCRFGAAGLAAGAAWVGAGPAVEAAAGAAGLGASVGLAGAVARPQAATRTRLVVLPASSRKPRRDMTRARHWFSVRSTGGCTGNLPAGSTPHAYGSLAGASGGAGGGNPRRQAPSSLVLRVDRLDLLLGPADRSVDVPVLDGLADHQRDDPVVVDLAGRWGRRSGMAVRASELVEVLEYLELRV